MSGDVARIKESNNELVSDELLAEIAALYSESLEALTERLRRAWFKQRPSGNVDDDLRAAIAHLAYVIVSHGRALRHLYEARDAEQFPTHLRPMFESMLKTNYLVHLHQRRAADVFDVLPFEQLRDANEYSGGDEFRKNLESACLEVVNRRPNLVESFKDPGSLLAGKIPLPYEKIRKRLELPNVKDMLRDLHDFDPGWSPDLYPTIFRLCSKFIHGSIGFTLTAIAWIRRDDHVAFRTEPSMEGATDFLLQGSGYLMGAAGMISLLFEGDNREAELNAFNERRERVIERLRGQGYILRITGRE